MVVCASCGHQFGVGRFCTNCGRRVDDAPAQADAPTPPPPADEHPSQARYPLFADDVAASGPLPPAPYQAPPPLAPPPPARGPRRTGDGWLPWTVGAVALLLVATTGALLLMTDGDGARDPAGAPAATDQTSGAPDEPGSPAPTEEPPADEGPLDLASYATAEVPDTAPPNQDVSGNPVHYEAANMLDGVPQTCWRMPGSGAGDEIVFTFEEPAEISEVGLINGYAKSSGDIDWYAGNRRVLEVEWVFDDGTTVGQTLDATRELQTVGVEPTTTTTVTLRLLEVSAPGQGRSARNYTPISDVSLVGAPA